MTDIPTDPAGLARAFGRGIFALYGHTPETAPPPLLGWVKAWRANAEAILTATPALCKAAPAALGAAVINLAKMGLVPGIPGDASATGYLYPGQGGPMGVPSARGRIALARAAGLDVETIPVATGDTVTLNVDGDVVDCAPNPDARPTRWEHLRGVIVRTEDVRTGAVRRHWISAGEIESRKARSKGNGPWQTDPVGMARGKAVKILVDRGILPQAPIPVPGLREWYATAPAPTIDAPAARALPAPAEPEPADAPPAAPTTPETAPAAPTEPDPEPTDATADPDPTTVEDVAGDLAADAECSRDHAEQAIGVAVEALRAAGKPHHDGALRAPPVWGRLIQRAAALARAAEAEATEA